MDYGSNTSTSMVPVKNGADDILRLFKLGERYRALILTLPEFALSLHESLLTTSSHMPPLSSSELHHYIEILSADRIVAAESYKQFDEQGTKLWNLSWKLRKNDETSEKLCCLGMAVPIRSFIAVLTYSPRVFLFTSRLRSKELY